MFPIRQDLQRKTLEAKERIEKEAAAAKEKARQYFEESRRLAEAELESRIGSTIAYISMRMDEAAEEGKTSIEYNFGGQANQRLVKAVTEKFKDFSPKIESKPSSYCICYDTGNWGNIQIEILTLSW